MADVIPSLDAALEAFGVPATIRPPLAAVVEGATVIFLAALTDPVPGGAEVQRSEGRWIVSLPRATVPVVPQQTIIEASWAGHDRWRVDGFDRLDLPDEIRVSVMPDPA